MDQNAPVPNHSEVPRQVPGEGYSRSAHGNGSATLTPPPPQPQRTRPRRRSPRWLVWLMGIVLAFVLVILLVCALIGGLVMGIAIKLANEVTVNATSTQTFTVTDVPSLDIHNASGRVQVRQGAPGVVSIETTRIARDTSQNAARADLDNIEVNTTQTGNQIALTTNVTDESYFASSSTVNLILTVPANTNIMADVMAGDVQIDSISGVMEITVGAGSVHLQDTVLADGSRIHISTGSAMLLGRLLPDASVDISVNTGNVALRLPADAAANLDARTNAGNIHINGWSLQPRQMNRGGAIATGTLGEQPTGTVRIRVDAGDITISQQ